MPRFFHLWSTPSGEFAKQFRFRRAVAFLGVFLFWWGLTALVYHSTESNFLRAESGWYLFLSHSAPSIQHDFEKVLLTTSFKGHYAPLAFLTEFATAKVVGASAGFWKWRQITVVALLATTLFFFGRNCGSAWGVSRRQDSLAAAGLTAILIFQPQMREFIAWPFMIMQLVWLLFTLLALLSLIRMGQHPVERLWPWLAAGAAYASLQVLGLGLATVAATASVLLGIGWAQRRSTPFRSSEILAPLLTMIGMTTLHALLIVNFARTEAMTPSGESTPIAFVAAALGFIPNLAMATLRSLFSTSQGTSDVWQITQDWPYGVAALVGLSFVVSSAYVKLVRQPSPRAQASFIMRTFASASFLAMIALIAARHWHEPSARGFAEFLGGARYLIPSTFALAGFLAEILFCLCSAPPFLGAFLNLGLGLCVIIANLHFAAVVYPKVAPRSMISHARAWQSVVTMAKECRQADLAIPDVPLDALTQEFFGWDLKLFEPLLRADLKMAPKTNLAFIPWADFKNGPPNESYRKVRSMEKVRSELQLVGTKGD